MTFHLFKVGDLQCLNYLRCRVQIYLYKKVHNGGMIFITPIFCLSNNVKNIG